MRASALLFMLLAVPAAAQSPGEAPPTFKVLDIVYKIEDMGGRVDDLKIQETPTELRVEMAADVLFDFDKADLLSKAETTLQKAADFIRQRSSGTSAVRIEGHTDGKGSDSYNLSLSRRRAESVRRWFETHGLSNLRFTTQGFGAKKPVAPNTKPDGSDDPVGRQKNRRVEIVIKK